MGDEGGEQRSPLDNDADASGNATFQMVDTGEPGYVTADLRDRVVELLMKQEKILFELLPRQRTRSKDQPIC